MILVCPHCGSDLQHELKDGLAQCFKCSQMVESSDLHQLLSAAWLVRRNHFSMEQLRHHAKIDEDASILVHTFVHEHGYSHQDFCALLKKLGVAHKSYIKY